MKTCTFILSVVLAAAVHADVIHLSNGKDVNGTVTGYGNMAFEINIEGSDVRQSAATIKSIEFSPRNVKLEVRGRPAIEGNLTAYEGGAFVIQQANGKTEKVAAMMIGSASFGGSVKKFLAISGGGAVDLKKLLAPGKITLVQFYQDSHGPSKTVAAQLEKLNKEDPDVVVRRVDIVKIGSAVCKQFDIKGVPRIHIYDRAGKLTGGVSGTGFDAVDTYVKAAKGAK